MRPYRFSPAPHRLALACVALTTLLATLLTTISASAAPEAKVLRIDPRASQESGNPILTTVVEVVQSKRVSEATAGCAGQRGNALFDCMSAALEQPFALYTPFGFPAKDGKTNAVFTVAMDGMDRPAEFVSATKWGEQQQQPGVGTAWLILIDADKRIGAAFGDAKQVAARFVATMGPNDIVNIMFFNDRQVVKDSKWMPSSDKAKGEAFINSVGSTFASQGRNRSLLTIIKNAATDGFKALGNAGQTLKVPMHQAMVVLSSGFGGTDPSTTGPGAMQVASYMTGGRFPEDNTALPKAPVPVISVYFPHKSYDEFRQNSLDFMQNLANPEIGGFFTIMREGQGERAGAIVNTVRTRFSKLHIVKWRVSCIAPSVTQTFKLVFNNVNPPILGDSTFKDVPVGVDPSTWPLDVNIQYSQEIAKRQPVQPAGRFKLYGNFCWGGSKERAEVYFLPTGQQLPAELGGTDIDKAKRTQQQLIAMGMKGIAIEASDTFVEFEAPDKDKILHGSGKQAVVRLIVYDNKAHRTSGVTSDSIIQLPGSERDFPVLIILGGAFGVVVLLLLVAVVIRTSTRKRGGSPPPAPVVAGAAYGHPPAGGYAPPPGGYGQPMPAAAPVPAPAAAPQPAAAPAPTPAGGVSPEFMYGTPGAAPPAAPPAAAPAAAPPDPYAQAPAAQISRATLQGAAGVFTVVAGTEMRAGRDGAQCAILLTEPRVSAVHATVKIEGGQLLVRDENSNNGTQVNGNRLSPGVWTPTPNGSLVRFGPVEFNVRLE